VFTLPENGPNGVKAEYAYSFQYSNALYIVLDSNFSIEEQTPWLEEQLATTTATWKFVMFHHPVFSSRRARDNPELRDAWTPVFDKHHVDIAFTGHDHAYLRTFPMNGGQKVATAAEGTYYIVSVAGSKYYDQEVWDYAEKHFPEVSTYQHIDIQTNPNRLTYKAYDEQGTVRDEFSIQK
jgi:3',5'-cyclic AMP phosphodiesterase CpdA